MHTPFLHGPRVWARLTADTELFYRKKYSDQENQLIVRKLINEMKSLEPTVPQSQVKGMSIRTGKAFNACYTQIPCIALYIYMRWKWVVPEVEISYRGFK